MKGTYRKDKTARVQVRLSGHDMELKNRIEEISKQLNIPVSELIQSELKERFQESGILPASR